MSSSGQLSQKEDKAIDDYYNKYNLSQTVHSERAQHELNKLKFKAQMMNLKVIQKKQVCESLVTPGISLNLKEA